MKFGVRTPSISRSIKARTTGRVKRAVKKSVNPLYGKKGMTMVKDPSKAVYNAVYRKTSVSAVDLLKSKKSGNTERSKKRQAINKSQINADERLVLLEEMERATDELNALIPIINSIEDGKIDLDLYIEAYDESIEIMQFLLKCKAVFNINSNEGFERNIKNLTVNRVIFMNGAIDVAAKNCSGEIDKLSQNAAKLKRVEKFKNSVLNHASVLSPSNMVMFQRAYNDLLDKIDVEESKKEQLDLDELISKSNAELEPNFSLDEEYELEQQIIEDEVVGTPNNNQVTTNKSSKKIIIIAIILFVVFVFWMIPGKDDIQSTYVDNSEIDIEETYYNVDSIDDFMKYYEEGDHVTIKGVYEFGTWDEIQLTAKDENGDEHWIKCNGLGLSDEEATEYEDNYSHSRRNVGEGKKAIFTISGTIYSIEPYEEDEYSYKQNILKDCKIEDIKVKE